MTANAVMVGKELMWLSASDNQQLLCAIKLCRLTGDSSGDDNECHARLP